MFSTSFESSFSYLFGDQSPRLLNDFNVYSRGSKSPYFNRAYVVGGCLFNLGTVQVTPPENASSLLIFCVPFKKRFRSFNAESLESVD